MSNTFKKLSTKGKFQYIFDYYRWHIILGLVVFGILFSIIYNATHKHSPALSVACINTPTCDNLNHVDSILTQGYASYENTGINPNDIELIRGFRIANTKDSVDYEYTYASNMKFLARITDKAVDVVIVDKKALHTLEKNGYLMKLPKTIVSDSLDGKQAGKSQTTIDGKQTGKSQGDSDAIRLNCNKELYAAVIKNTPHQKEALSYLKYLKKADL